MEVRVIAVPPGEAPEHIRRAWLGLVLPLAPWAPGPVEGAECDGPTKPVGVFATLARLLTGRYPGGLYYVTSVDAALAVLERASPGASAWWLENTPHLIGANRTFQIAAGVCEEVPGPGDRSTRPHRLRVGSREVAVGTTPLFVSKANFQTKSFRRVGDQLLVVKPTGYKVFSLVSFFFGTLLVWAAVSQAIWGTEPVLKIFFAACGGSIFLVIGVGLWFLPRRFEFDREAGRMRVSRSARNERPLRDVLAVQLIEQPRGRKIGTTYQINLVLDDIRRPRVNLSNHTDLEATRTDGADLANFLGVPLLDDVTLPR